MDNHSRKRSHLLSPHRKPIKHTLLENHYIEKQKEDPAIKRQNPRITQFVLVAVCSLSLIGAVCWIMLPQDKRTSATAYQPSPSPTGMFTSRSKPNILIELDEQQSSKPHTLVTIAGNVNNQPQPKQQATTAAIPLPSADNTPEPPSSSTTPDTPAEPPKPQEPTTPTTPQPDDPPPAGDTSPACRPSIWNLFWCGD
ncbi:hypothetical protein C1X05_00510 [Laceyella sacchari]|nr:hypothetical protein C1X05_00510 [Laceyella sacchari]